MYIGDTHTIYTTHTFPSKKSRKNWAEDQARGRIDVEGRPLTGLKFWEWKFVG